MFWAVSHQMCSFTVRCTVSVCMHDSFCYMLTLRNSFSSRCLAHIVYGTNESVTAVDFSDRTLICFCSSADSTAHIVSIYQGLTTICCQMEWIYVFSSPPTIIGTSNRSVNSIHWLLLFFVLGQRTKVSAKVKQRSTDSRSPVLLLAIVWSTAMMVHVTQKASDVKRGFTNDKISLRRWGIHDRRAIAGEHWRYLVNKKQDLWYVLWCEQASQQTHYNKKTRLNWTEWG